MSETRKEYLREVRQSLMKVIGTYERRSKELSEKFSSLDPDKAIQQFSWGHDFLEWAIKAKHAKRILAEEDTVQALKSALKDYRAILLDNLYDNRCGFPGAVDEVYRGILSSLVKDIEDHLETIETEVTE